MSGLVLSRKLFMPPGGGFLRYLEIVENPTATPLNVRPDVYGDLTAPAKGVWSYIVDPTGGSGYAIVQGSDDASMPQVGMVLQGNGAVPAPLLTDWTWVSSPDWYWETTAPAGDKACILHFIFQAPPQDASTEMRAQALRDLDSAALQSLGLDPNPLYGLSAEERACIKNSIVPPAP
jgi:hypothetical protein